MLWIAVLLAAFAAAVAIVGEINKRNHRADELRRIEKRLREKSAQD